MFGSTLSPAALREALYFEEDDPGTVPSASASVGAGSSMCALVVRRTCSWRTAACISAKRSGNTLVNLKTLNVQLLRIRMSIFAALGERYIASIMPFKIIGKENGTP